ncbi:hypothetical protein [Maribacter halichondriae]|uniref:hypothetical protein n=1 Tax=Maribacter halichondriae TaxID=2980554 RepID=UPI00235810D8|nr:hypothetical protein [Maribacter sp. Hal144]
MKTIKVLLPMFILIGLSACEKENLFDFGAQGLIENPIPSPLPQEDLLPEDFVNLTFTVRSQEDQMGKFAENAMVEFNGKIWSIGGKNEHSAGTSLNAVWASDNGEHWYSVTSGLFDERSAHTLTVFDNKMWLIGGVNNSGRHLSNVWYSEDGSTWVLATDTPAFGSAAYHNTIVFNGKLFLIGDASGGYIKVWSSVDGIEWEEENSMAFSSRENFRTVVFNNIIYVIGGNYTSISFNEIWASNDGTEWSQVTPSGTIFSARFAHTVTVHEGRVWVVGGSNVSPSDFVLDFWYSDDMVEWIEYSGALPSTEGLANHAALSYNGEIWLFGGYQDEGSAIRMIGSIRSIHAD